jgi:uncharacterized paraquat-inducible protein A
MKKTVLPTSRKSFGLAIALGVAALFPLVLASCVNSKEKIAPNQMDHDQSMKKKSPAQGDSFTCSMHPEVTEVQAGDCPKCGMKLMKRAPEAVK